MRPDETLTERRAKVKEEIEASAAAEGGVLRDPNVEAVTAGLQPSVPAKVEEEVISFMPTSMRRIFGSFKRGRKSFGEPAIDASDACRRLVRCLEVAKMIEVTEAKFRKMKYWIFEEMQRVCIFTPYEHVPDVFAEADDFMGHQLGWELAYKEMEADIARTTANVQEVGRKLGVPGATAPFAEGDAESVFSVATADPDLADFQSEAEQLEILSGAETEGEGSISGGDVTSPQMQTRSKRKGAPKKLGAVVQEQVLRDVGKGMVDPSVGEKKYRRRQYDVLLVKAGEAPHPVAEAGVITMGGRYFCSVQGCKAAGSSTYTTVRRHVLEQHWGMAYECPACKGRTTSQSTLLKLHKQNEQLC